MTALSQANTRGRVVDQTKFEELGVDDKAITGAAVSEIRADVISFQEVENVDTLKHFRARSRGGRRAYPSAPRAAAEGGNQRPGDRQLLPPQAPVFYSSVTTAGVTALDPARASLAGGIVYMFQIAGGAVGLGVNTALVAATTTSTAGHLVSGIRTAFTVDAILAAANLIVTVLFIGGSIAPDATRAHRPHLHRAHL
jgi:hypothetical protein